MFDVSDEMIVPINAEVPDRPSVFFDPQFQLPAIFGDGPAVDGRGLIAEVEEHTTFVAGIGLAPDGEVTPEAVGLYRALRGGFIRGVVTGGLPRAAGAVGGPDLRRRGPHHRAQQAGRAGPGSTRAWLGRDSARSVDLVVRDATVAECPHGAFGLLATISGVTSSARRSIPPADGRSPEPGQPEHRRAMDRPGGANHVEGVT